VAGARHRATPKARASQVRKLRSND
jgi:hypothetical protein